MDPFFLMLLMIGAAAIADEEHTVPTLWRALGMDSWHFAWSWDWEPYASSFLAPDEAGAWEQLEEEACGEDPGSSKYRVYALIRGGRSVGTHEMDQPVPAGVSVNVVWQNEQDIEAICVPIHWDMQVEEAVRLAWQHVPVDSEVRSLAGPGEMLSPDLVVIGGSFAFVETL